jgi:hypothetical protein
LERVNKCRFKNFLLLLINNVFSVLVSFLNTLYNLHLAFHALVSFSYKLVYIFAIIFFIELMKIFCMMFLFRYSLYNDLGHNRNL